MISRAEFSADRRYRYRLWRGGWMGGTGTINFIMLNPSTADEYTDDPTIRRCITRAKTMRFETLVVTNLFGKTSVDPKEILGMRLQDAIGPENDAVLRRTAEEADMVIAGWGNHGAYCGRSDAVLRLLSGVKIYALELTKTVEPRHPLYVSYKTEPFPWKGRGIVAR